MAIIVIEGLDGSGKSTQVDLLKNFFIKQGRHIEYLHFPRLDSPVYGDLIARFLRGEMGDIYHVNPYLVALLYAGDRFNAKSMIEQWNRQNVTIILDRYVYSNIAYQCAKLQQPSEIEMLKSWIIETEFEYFKLPKPDLNIFLDVPFEFTKRKLTEHRTGSDRTYLEGKPDIHEGNIDFQSKVRRIYLSLENEWFVKIDCGKDPDTMHPPDLIFNKIIGLLEMKQII